MQLDIEDRAHGFEIQRNVNLFMLVDRSTFNNWGIVGRQFATREEAEDYARRCDDFKRGKRSQVEYHDWEVQRGPWR